MDPSDLSLLLNFPFLDHVFNFRLQLLPVRLCILSGNTVSAFELDSFLNGASVNDVGIVVELSCRHETQCIAIDGVNADDLPRRVDDVEVASIPGWKRGHEVTGGGAECRGL